MQVNKYLELFLNINTLKLVTIKEIIMSNILKDIGELFISAGDEIEKKTHSFKEKHQEDFDKFKTNVKQGKEDFQKKFKDEVSSAKERLSDALSNFGSSSKKEIDELKAKLDELSAKLDELSKSDGNNS